MFRLSCDEVAVGGRARARRCAARGYNGMIPGPVLRATEGDTVRIIVKNNLTESTAIHWHGLYVPNNMDGVPFINQEPIKPGASFTYEFTLRNPGTHMYHSHHNSLDQVNRGLLGAFIVDPKDTTTYPALRPRVHPDPQRPVAGLHDQRQGLPGDGRAGGQAGRAGAHPLHERRA